MPIAILAGIGWHTVGAACAASFYAPIEKVKKWSWETTWALAGPFLLDSASHRREPICCCLIFALLRLFDSAL